MNKIKVLLFLLGFFLAANSFSLNLSFDCQDELNKRDAVFYEQSGFTGSDSLVGLNLNESEDDEKVVLITNCCPTFKMFDCESVFYPEIRQTSEYTTQVFLLSTDIPPPF